VVPGCDVLLVDDTWVSGASAQSAAIALKRAGAGQVAVVVLGRHVNPADPHAGPLARSLRMGHFDPADCAVHVPKHPPVQTPD
jgi:orotate phosphoribosyltransferase